MAGSRGRAARIIANARALIGTRFRLHGRDPETGLDCVGFVACAVGVRADIPTGYALRGGHPADFIAMIDCFATRRARHTKPGDVVFLSLGGAQYHLGIYTGTSLIHAHAGLWRVVETPGAPEGDMLAAWFYSERSR